MKSRKRRSHQPKRNSRLVLGVVSIIILVAFMSLYVFRKSPTMDFQSKGRKQKAEMKNPDFTIGGKLSFFTNKGDSITSISIEIADDNYSRQMGMMYRHFIPDTVGMLFIFPGETQRSFWMKNTPSSLDIIYANKQMEIVRVWENTFPYSEEPIPSGDRAKYVIEVAAGFCARHRISADDKFEYFAF